MLEGCGPVAHFRDTDLPLARRAKLSPRLYLICGFRPRQHLRTRPQRVRLPARFSA